MAHLWRSPIAVIFIALCAVALGWTGTQLAAPSPKRAPRTSMSQRAQARLVSHTAREIVIEFESPFYEVSRDPETDEAVQFTVKGAQLFHQPGFPLLPVIAQPVDCPPGEIQLQILQVEEEQHPLPKFRALMDDQRVVAKDDDLMGDILQGEIPEQQETKTLRTEGCWPHQAVELHEGGVFRGHRLMSLRFYPVRLDLSKQTLQWTRRARVRLLLPAWEGTPEFLNRRYDAPNETALLENILGPLAPVALQTHQIEDQETPVQGIQTEFSPRFKILIAEEGVYRISQEMLASAGVPVEQIDPRTIKIKVRDNEIPIFVQGEVDGIFDSYDYLEFYGIENRGTYVRPDRGVDSSGGEKVYYSSTEAIYKDPWSDENVYWLSWNGPYGRRLGEENADWLPNVGEPVLFLRTTIHYEEDRYYNQLTMGAVPPPYPTLLSNEGPYGVIRDHWFYTKGVGGFGTIDIPVHIFYPDTQSLGSIHQVILRAALQGLSFGHHRAILYLNGCTDKGLSIGRISQSDDRVAWKGQSAVIVQTKAPDPLNPAGITNQNLRHGDNTLSLAATGDGLAGALDQVTLDWVEVTYERVLRAAGGYFRFQFDTTRNVPFEFDIRGFRGPNIEIWKLDMARLTNAEVRRVSPENEPSSWAVRFLMTPSQAYEMIVFDDAYPKTPAAILPEYSTRDLRTLPGAEYIMLVHESFLSEPAVEELRQRRQATFPRGVEVVAPTEIYEQFNRGIVNPEAIRNFVMYAYNHWTIRPTHLCIIGDGNYDVKDYFHFGGNLIPSLYVMAGTVGRAPSDALFGCVSGPPWDLVPDVAVGRISCRTSEELETYVDKVAIYEDNSDYTSAWHSNYVFVADKRDADFNFAGGFSEPIVHLMPDYVNVTRVYSDSLLPAERVTALREAFRQGGVIVNYNGHGGGGLWSGDELMTVSSERQLLNRRKFPFITSFTCYSAVFDQRHQSESLGEAFLFQRNPNGDLIGGIGVYASTSLAYAYTGISMQTHLFDFFPTPPRKTLGEIVQTSKTKFWMAYSGQQLGLDPVYSMQVLMNLLGDPGVKLAIPKAVFEPEIDTTFVVPGDTVLIRGTLPFELVGQANIVQVWYNPYDERKIRLAEENPLPEIITTELFDSPPLAIPSSFNWHEGRYIIYVCNPETKEDGVGSVSFYSYDLLDATIFEDVSPWPSSIVTTDSAFYIQARVLNRNGIDRVLLRGVFTPPQGPPVLDTLAMEEGAANLWRTPMPLGPYNVDGATYHAAFVAHDRAGGIDSSLIYQMPFATKPDIAHASLPYSPPRLMGETYPHLQVVLVKTTPLYSSPIDTLLVKVVGYRFPTFTDTFETYAEITGVDALSKAFTVDIPVHLRPGRWRLNVVIDPLDQIAESNEDNNRKPGTLNSIDHFPVSRVQGTYYENPLEFPVYNKFWQFNIPDTLELRIFPGSLLQDSSVLIYATPRWLSPAESLRAAQIGIFAFPDTTRSHVFAVTLADSTDRLAPSGVVDVSLFERTSATPDTAGKYIFQRRLGSEFWTKLPTISCEVVRDSFENPQGGWVVYQRGVKYFTRTNHLGTFTMFRPLDTRPPQIDIVVNGERFVPGAFVPADPQMFVYISDANGIDRRADRFRIVLDGDTVLYSEVGWADSVETSGDQVALIRPHLDIGGHDIEVYACDNLGNDTTYSAAFQVEGVFGIDFALNYPNPFTEQTKIVYILTGPTDEYVKVKIYTVAGRLISTLEETERAVINYRTLTWDGRDKDGEDVANGVYFARIIASQGGKRVEKVLKMAKVR